ncbi:MAG: apolipoprotein N-acyltransferase [Candidatus Omnitrophota bacterium]|nr:MAG: apolipoprotein N-acyltransferase [Candidatus Omnitrophota bacterium]RKY44473.1 MAG: apolipoprotein N-acyltransferase [Candidatus Omnitrophota bacterium]
MDVMINSRVNIQNFGVKNLLQILFFSSLSGFLTGLSFNSPNLSFLIWFSLIFLLRVLKNNSYPKSFFYSFIAGFIHFLTVVFWIGFVTRLGLFFLLLYLSLYWAIPSLGIKKLLEKNFNFLLVPLLWVVFEYLRAKWGGFGWALFGYSQFKNIALIQIVNLLGVWPVSFLIVLFNVVLFNFLEKRKLSQSLLSLLVFLFLLSSFFFYGYSSLKRPSFKDKSSLVSLVQPNIAQEKKWQTIYYQEIKDKLVFLLRQAPPGSLVIFPEASWPYSAGKDFAELKLLAKTFKRDILMGVVEKSEENYFNTAVLISKQGRFSKYRKLKLVPFGEYIPLRRFLSFISVVNSFGDISAGKEVVLLNYKNLRIATLICFEDLFPDLVRDFVRKGANVLVNITNDAWFKGYPQVIQHLQPAVFRAIEERRYLLRAANTGISCIISPQGEIEKILRVNNKKIFVEGLLNGKIFLSQDETFYSQWPDIFIYIGGILGLVLLVFDKKIKF